MAIPNGRAGNHESLSYGLQKQWRDRVIEMGVGQVE